MSHEAKLSIPFVVICCVLMLFLMILTSIDPYIIKRQRKTFLKNNNTVLKCKNIMYLL